MKQDWATFWAQSRRRTVVAPPGDASPGDSLPGGARTAGIGAVPGGLGGWRRTARRAEPTKVMPYLYVATLALIIYFLDPGIIASSTAASSLASVALPLCLVAFGQSLVIFTGGMDLSVGGIMSLGTVLLATHGGVHGPSLVLEVVLVAALGAAAGAINGVIIAHLDLQPFIVTLATWSIWGGVAYVILSQPGGNPAPGLQTSLLGSVGEVPEAAFFILALAVGWLWLRRTRLITDLLALGSDRHRALLSGVRINLRLVECYALSGLMAALAAVWVTASTATGDPTAGNQYILDSVAAVVIGGNSIFGGAGSAGQSIVGAFVLLLIPNLVFALNLQSFWSVLIEGALLIVAVTVSSLLWRRREAE
jgi:ribose transport system permease protein